MAVRNDLNQLNDAGTEGDWNTSGFDSPKLNNSSSTIPYFIEGSDCMDFPLKKGQTDGHTYDDIGNVDFTDRVFVAHYYIPGPDVSNIPLNEFWVQLSSDSGFTSNYGRWDALPFFAAAPGSFVALPVFPSNADETNGTLVVNSVSSMGFTATTGGSNDGKAGAFDHFYDISEFGGHSETWTDDFFDDLIDDGTNGADAEVAFGVLSRSGAFFESKINFAIGNDVAANTTVDESGKTIYFNNLQADHKLGYIFYGGSSGQVNFDITGLVHFWNSQNSSAEIFSQTNETDIFRIDGCSFTNGGNTTLPAWVSDANTFVQNSNFSNCQPIDINSILFEGNTIADATEGVFYSGTGTRRSKDNTYLNNTDAVHFDTAQTITMDGDQFSGNTDDIHFSGSGTLTVNAINGANPVTSRVSGGGTVVINNAVTVRVTCIDQLLAPVEDAIVTLTAKDGTGDLPFEDSVTITSSGTTATVSHTAHNMKTGQEILIDGANQVRYNGVFTITVTGANSYTYTMLESATSPATGTIIATGVALFGISNASGIVENTGFPFTVTQSIIGDARKGAGAEVKQPALITGNIVTGTGFTATATMNDD